MNAELTLLRDFYAAWVGLHSIPRTPGKRKQQEEAAQKMVDCAHALRTLYQAEHAPMPEAANG